MLKGISQNGRVAESRYSSIKIGVSLNSKRDYQLRYNVNLKRWRDKTPAAEASFNLSTDPPKRVYVFLSPSAKIR